MPAEYDSDGYCLECGRENYRHYDSCSSYVSWKQQCEAFGIWPFNDKNEEK